MEPELTKIDQISGNRELKLSDFAAFIMLCLAGSFVLFQVQSLAQGIVGGLGHADWTAFAQARLQGSFLEPRGDRPIGTDRPRLPSIACRRGSMLAAAEWRRHCHAANDHVQWNAKIGREGRCA